MALHSGSDLIFKNVHLQQCTLMSPGTVASSASSEVLGMVIVTFCVFAPGGLSSFKQNHENLCDNSLQLQECREVGGGASAASSMLPQSVPTTPDIENAELTPILPFLFLGNEQDAQDLDTMQRLNIGYVINVTTHLPLYHYEKGLFNYKRLPATDSNKQNLRQYFEEAFEFIGNYLPRGLLVFLLPCPSGFCFAINSKVYARVAKKLLSGVFGLCHLVRPRCSPKSRPAE